MLCQVRSYLNNVLNNNDKKGFITILVGQYSKILCSIAPYTVFDLQPWGAFLTSAQCWFRGITMQNNESSDLSG